MEIPTINLSSLKSKYDTINTGDMSTICTKSTNHLVSPRKINVEIPELSIDIFNSKSNTKELLTSYISKKISKNKQYSSSNKDKYKLLMKKLDIWDKEHLSVVKEDPDLLYQKLSTLYRKINLVKEQKKLDQFHSLLRSKSNFNKIIEKGSTTNKILEEFFNQRNKDQGSILKNNITKTKTRFNFSLFQPKNQKEIEQNIGVDSKTINAMSSGDINNEYYTKVIKEKMKYENQLHSELISVNNEIYEKKIEKKLTNERLSNIYNQKSQLTKNFNVLFNRRKSVLEKFQEDYERQQLNNNNNKKKLKHGIRRVSKISNFLLNMEASKKNVELKQNIKAAQIEYVENMKSIDSEKKICLEEINRIDKEMNFYKQVNDELIKEHRQYYMEILKSGYDSRGEGMIWVVRNLLELQTNLEYHHFPKFLTHEQIDYLLKIATISLEEIQLKIILKVLKKKQNDLKVKENIRRISVVEEFFANKSPKRNTNDEENNKRTHRRVLTDYERQKIKIRKEINKKFIKLYTRNEETMRMFGDKNMEENKDEAFIETLRDSLFGRRNLKNESLLKIFEGDKLQQKILSIIIYIRQRLEDLKFIKQKITEDEINTFKDSQKYDEANLDVNQLMQKELVKKCLFGSSSNF